MNKDLEYLLSTGDIIGKRTLQFFMNRLETDITTADCDFRVGSIPVAFSTEYLMEGKLGPFKWYITWIDKNCPDKKLAREASIYIHDARARLYFPAYLDSRIPPENREDLQHFLDRYGMEEYDKFDMVKNTKAWSPIKLGNVREIEPIDCDLDEIHAIEEIVEEYKKTL